MTYILYHLELVWQFVFGKREALYDIDATRSGLWRSFLAMLIVEPVGILYALLFGFIDRLFPPGGGLLFYLQHLILDWALVPLVLWGLASLFSFRDRLIPLIVSYNWLGVIVMVLTLLPGALVTSQMAGAGLSSLILIGIYGFGMWITYRLIIFVLDCPPGMAAALTTLILILNITSAIMLSQMATELTVAATEQAGSSNMPMR